MKSLNCDSFDSFDFISQSVVMLNHHANHYNYKNHSSDNCSFCVSLTWHGTRHSHGMGLVAHMAWDSSLDRHGRSMKYEV
jgi:hypothetical protein